MFRNLQIIINRIRQRLLDYHKSMGVIVVISSFIALAAGPGVLNAYGVYEEEYDRLFDDKDDKNGDDDPESVESPVIFIGVTQILLGNGMGFIGGQAAQRFGPGPAVFLGGVLMSLGLFTASYAKQQVWKLCLTQGLVFGLGVTLTWIPAASAPSSWFDKNKGLATGITHMGLGIGGLIFSPLIRFLLEKAGTSGSLRWLSLIVLVFVTIASLGIHTKKQNNNHRRGSFDEIALSRVSWTKKLEDELNNLPENGYADEAANSIGIIGFNTNHIASKCDYSDIYKEKECNEDSNDGHSDENDNAKTTKRCSILEMSLSKTKKAKYDPETAEYEYCTNENAKTNTCKHSADVTTDTGFDTSSVDLKAPEPSHLMLSRDQALSVLKYTTTLQASDVQNQEIAWLAKTKQKTLEKLNGPSSMEKGEIIKRSDNPKRISFSPITAASSLRKQKNLDVLKSMRFWFLSLGVGLGQAGWYVVLLFMTSIGVSVGLDVHNAAIVLGFVNGASAIGQFTSGYAADIIGPINSILVFTFLSTISNVILFIPNLSFHLLLLYACLCGASIGAADPLAVITGVTQFGKSRAASTTGLIYGSVGILVLICAPLASIMPNIINYKIDYTPVYTFIVLLFTMSTLFLLALRLKVSTDIRARV